MRYSAPLVTFICIQFPLALPGQCQNEEEEGKEKEEEKKGDKEKFNTVLVSILSF